jgi:hypothetical protein
LDLQPGIVILNPRTWAAALGVFAFAYFLGSLLCLRWQFSSFAEAALKRLAAGLALAPVAVLLAGQSQGLLFSFPWWLGSAAGLVLFSVHVYRERNLRSESATDDQLAQLRDRVLWATGWLAIVATAIILLGPAFTPPINYDALEYHVGVIPHFFEIRRIAPIPHVFYTAQPIATEMLYTLGAVLESTPWGIAPGLVGWFLFIATIAIMSRALAAARTPAIAVPWLILLFISAPIVFKIQLDRFTDLTGAFFLLAGFCFARENAAAAPARSALMTGLMAGAAISSKWTNAGTTALILALVLLAGDLNLKSVARDCAAFAAGIFIVMLSWLAWVGVSTGNPFAPFLAGIFHSAAWTPDQLDFLLDTHGPLSMLSPDFWLNLYRRLSSLALTPPIFIAAILAWLAIAARWRRDHPREQLRAAQRDIALAIALALGIVAGFLLWGRLRFAADRFLTPLIAAEILLLGASIGVLARSFHNAPAIDISEAQSAIPAKNASSLAAIAVAVIAIFYWPVQLSRVKDAQYWNVALGRETPNEFLRRGLGETAKFFEAANALPPDSRILAIGEARRYYFRPRVTLASVFDIHPIRTLIDSRSTPEQIAHGLRSLGYTHLAVNEYESARLLDFHPPPILEQNEQFMDSRSQGRAGPDERARAYAAFARDYAGHSEFGVNPLSPEARRAYLEFLNHFRQRAIYFSSGPNLYPALWISPL